MDSAVGANPAGAIEVFSSAPLVSLRLGKRANVVNWVDATGVRFGFADDTYYPDPSPAAFYEHLPARILICTDMMSGGPFQPKGWLILTWDGVIP